jgi:DNA polymerase
MRGSWHDFAGIPVRVTFHPSYLLRSDQDLTTKRQVWEDMLTVMERLEMPVSEKQRGFFLPKKS